MRHRQQPSADRFLSIQKGDFSMMIAGGRTSMLCVSFLPVIVILVVTLILAGNPLNWIALVYGGICLLVTTALTIGWWFFNQRYYDPIDED